MAKGHGPGDAMERRRGEVERIAAAGAQYFKITQEVDVTGAGEAAVSVNFPVFFVDKPAFSYGSHLVGGDVTLGNMPTCSVVVIGWHERIRDDGTNIYVGAQFAIVTNGATDQVCSVQCHIEGVGLRGPVND